MAQRYTKRMDMTNILVLNSVNKRQWKANNNKFNQTYY